ncbi:hypothetical protein GCM10020331_091600 [Ectobacillus funiculus]
MAEEIGCGFHHSGMERKRIAVEARSAWVDGRASRWIAATTGLGERASISKGIVAVVHMETAVWTSRLLCSRQVEEGGGQGKWSSRSSCMMDGLQREDRHRSFVDDINQGQMEAFISTPGCRRAVIAAFMDGVAGERCKGYGRGGALRSM